MSAKIPAAFRDLVERPVVAALGTLLPDGQVQVHPVWVGEEGGLLVVNTARGRQKDRNLKARPWATLLFVDPQEPERFLEVRGRVVAVREDGAREQLDALAMKYRGQETFPVKPGQVRVMYLIEPVRVITREA